MILWGKAIMGNTPEVGGGGGGGVGLMKQFIYYVLVCIHTKLGSFSFVPNPPPPPPPPSTLCSPQLQSKCHYIVHHYVKILHVHLGGANNMHPLSWGGHKRKRSPNWFIKKKNEERLNAVYNYWYYSIHLWCIYFSTCFSNG